MVLDLNKQYTYADYLTWLDDVRRELIEGFIKLFPSPHSDHADISGNMYRGLYGAVGNIPDLRIYYAPVDVILSEESDVDRKAKFVMTYNLQDGVYSDGEIFVSGESVMSKSINGLKLIVDDIFVL